MNAKLRNFIAGLVLTLGLFSLSIPFSTAVPNKDVTIDIKVKRVSGSAVNANGNASASNVGGEEIKPINGKYVVKQNDEISVEIHLLNPSSQKVISTETWLNYDPKKLTGITIDNTDSKFDLITPGENEFAPDQSLVRIGRGNTTGGIDDTNIKVVSVRFKVISAKKSDTTEIRFNDFQPNELGHTNVNVISGGLPFNVLSATAPKPVTLVLNGSVSAVSGSSSSSGGGANNSGSSSGSGTGSSSGGGVSTGSGTLFPSASGLPIPGNVRASTFGDSITVSWNPVGDLRVTHYYIYYTTHQNQYLHRKKVTGSSYTFSGLVPGDRYYFVMTSADAAGMESGYSPEVSITVGQNGSISISNELSQEAIDSLNKLSKTAGAGPAEDLLLIAFLSCLVYPSYKFLKKLAIRTTPLGV